MKVSLYLRCGSLYAALYHFIAAAASAAQRGVYLLGPCPHRNGPACHYIVIAVGIIPRKSGAYSSTKLNSLIHKYPQIKHIHALLKQNEVSVGRLY